MSDLDETDRDALVGQHADASPVDFDRKSQARSNRSRKKSKRHQSEFSDTERQGQQI